MGKLLAIDLDGTLFYPKRKRKCICKKNVKFLRKWIDAGNKVVLVTSRSTQFTEKLKDEIQRPIDFINCCSSQIISDDKMIYEKSMPNEKLKLILSFIEKTYQPIALLMTSENHPCIVKYNRKVNPFYLWFYRIWRWFQFSYREPYVYDNDLFEKELNSSKIYKIMVFIGLRKNKTKISKETNKELREAFTDIESSWTAQVNELTPAGCNKGDGVARYCELKNINSDDVYVIGDSGNDITMFNKFHEHSFCMKRGHPSVRKYAKTIVSRVYKLEDILMRGENHE